jgi:hypothetical protein
MGDSMPQKNLGFSSSISFSNGSRLAECWGAASSARSDNGYAFSPGDLVRVCHPNVNNKKHRDKTGTIQDRMSRGNKVWIKFSDDSTGAVDLIALVPIDTIQTSVKTIDV